MNPANQSAKFLSMMRASLHQLQNITSADQALTEDDFITKIQSYDLANLNKELIDGDKFLHFALNKNYFKLAKLLVEKGIDLNSQDSSGNTPLHIACYKDNHEMVKLLITNEIDLNLKNNLGLNALEIACQKTNVEIIKLLFDKDPNLFDLQSDNGGKSLYLASLCENLETIKSLLENGEKYDLQNSLATSLHLACSLNNIAIVQILIEKCLERGIDLNSKNPTGDNAFSIACFNQKINTAELLIAKGANFNTQNHYGNTPLHHATYKGYDDIIDLLLKQKNLKIDIKNNNGLTPLHHACIYGHHIAAKFLIKAGANIDLKDGDGNNALTIALKNGNIEVMKTLLELGASTNGIDIFHEKMDKTILRTIMERKFADKDSLDFFFKKITQFRIISIQYSINSILHVCVRATVLFSDKDDKKNSSNLAINLIKNRTTIFPESIFSMLDDNILKDDLLEKKRLFKELYKAVCDDHAKTKKDESQKNYKKELFSRLLNQAPPCFTLLTIIIEDNFFDHLNSKSKKTIKNQLQDILKSLNSKKNPLEEFEIDFLVCLKNHATIFTKEELNEYKNLREILVDETEKTFQITDYSTSECTEISNKIKSLNILESKRKLSSLEDKSISLDRELLRAEENLKRLMSDSRKSKEDKTSKQQRITKEISEKDEALKIINSKIDTAKKAFKTIEEKISQINSESALSSNLLVKKRETDLIVEKSDLDNFLKEFNYSKKKGSQPLFSTKSTKISQENIDKITEILQNFYQIESTQAGFDEDKFLHSFSKKFKSYLSDNYEIKIKPSQNQKFETDFRQLTELMDSINKTLNPNYEPSSAKTTQELPAAKDKALEYEKKPDKDPQEKPQYSSVTKQKEAKPNPSLTAEAKPNPSLTAEEDILNPTTKEDLAINEGSAKPSSSPRTSINYNGHEITFLRNLFEKDKKSESLMSLAEGEILSKQEDYLMNTNPGIIINDEKFHHLKQGQLKAIFHDKLDELIAIILPKEEAHDKKIRSLKSCIYGFIAYRFGSDEGFEQFLKNLDTLIKNSFKSGEYMGCGHASKASISELKQSITVLDELLEINKDFNAEKESIKIDNQGLPKREQKPIPPHPLRLDNFRKQAFIKFPELIKHQIEIEDEEFLDNLLDYHQSYSKDKYHSKHEDLVIDKFKYLQEEFIRKMIQSIDFVTDPKKRQDIILNIETQKIESELDQKTQDEHTNPQEAALEDNQDKWDLEHQRIKRQLLEFFGFEDLENSADLINLKGKFTDSEGKIFDDTQIRKYFLNFLHDRDFARITLFTCANDNNKLADFKEFAQKQFTLIESEYREIESIKTKKSSSDKPYGAAL